MHLFKRVRQSRGVREAGRGQGKFRVRVTEKKTDQAENAVCVLEAVSKTPTVWLIIEGESGETGREGRTGSGNRLRQVPLCVPSLPPCYFECPASDPHGNSAHSILQMTRLSPQTGHSLLKTACLCLLPHSGRERLHLE